MELYPWIVFIHAAALLLFFIAHGASMAVAFRVTRERDPARVRALLDLSAWSVTLWPSIAFIIGLAAGIAAGIMGDHFGRLWIWLSLVLLIVVSGVMTPMVAMRFNAVRAAAGIAVTSPFSRRPPAEPPALDEAELHRLLDAWNPIPTAAIGLGAFLVILWLMFFKPF
ncbi:MAG TPA: hypothetical protein VMP86_05330 [Candidatus Binatia bacterium]|nr:hypothetical protein [Candidatus Binatia bacterium]